LRRSATRF
ncbi:hypothetical protein MPH_04129, partial [Macrophomina phaseolina MS6]